MPSPHVLQVETTTHGRILLRDAPHSPAPLLVGFHGYSGNAEEFLDRMLAIPGASSFHVASIQALHPFYNQRMDQIVASWMTSQDRKLAIADNVAYVARALDSVGSRVELASTAIYLGFSQGASMAYRAACFSGHRCDGLIALVGDAPVDIEDASAQIVPHVLIGCGTDDDWYDKNKLEKDRKLLQRMGSSVEVCAFTGGHEWTDEFRECAGEFLGRIAG